MAKITINYDTTEKTMSVKLGSQVLEDVRGISVYPKWDEEGQFSIEVSQVTQAEKDGITVVTHTMASQDEGKTWIVAEKKDNDDDMSEDKKKKDKKKDKTEGCSIENLAKSLFPRKFE